MTATLDDGGITSRGEETRQRILDAALELFRERGYEETTMRAIAEKAGVALGNAYYYFRSKEHLIQGFYARTHDEHRALAAEPLANEKDLKKRLLGVMRAKLESAAPYHRFAGILFKSAADPNSPLNPFSEESRAVRADSTRLFARVVEGTSVKVPADLVAELPELLWLYQMGILLFWIHDPSPRAERTERLLVHTVDLVARLITVASHPILRPVRKRIVLLLKDLRKELE